MASDGALAMAVALVEAAVRGAVKAEAPRRTVAATGAACVSAALAALLGADGTRGSAALPSAVAKRRRKKKKRGSKKKSAEDEDMLPLRGGGGNKKETWLPSEPSDAEVYEEGDGDASASDDGDGKMQSSPPTQGSAPSALASGEGAEQQKGAAPKSGGKTKGGFTNASKGRGPYDAAPRKEEGKATPEVAGATVWHKQQGRGQRRRP